MKTEWIFDYPVDDEWLPLLQDASARTEAEEGINVPISVSVRFCSDEQIHELNRQFRCIDRETDVLSFPTVRYPEGKTAGQCRDRLRKEYDDETGACFLGDIVISVPRLKAQAKEYGHSEAREAAYLLVHGLCHLMGYDHMEEEEKKKMRRMEEKILSFIGVTRDE